MIDSRRIGLAVPAVLGALAAALAVALVVARTERPSRSLVALTPGIVNASPGAAPEVADLNAQLAQIAALHATPRYGGGLARAVRDPIPALRPLVGEEWHELHNSGGQLTIQPTGEVSGLFEVSLVAVSERGPARLAVSTSAGQRAIEPVNNAPYSRITLGPLLAPKGGGITLFLSSLAPLSASPGPSLILSPPQAEYLSSGEWVAGMPALAEIGAGGRRGVYLAVGSTTPFAMTPGVTGRCEVTLEGASAPNPLDVTVAVGRTSRAAVVGTQPGVVRVGPFTCADPVLSLSVRAGSGHRSGALFISNMAFVAG